MMWTEDEAKKKWCPMADSNSTSNSCIASGCMMWRKKDQMGIGPNGEKRDRDLDGRTRWLDRGYCGLAGGAFT